MLRYPIDPAASPSAGFRLLLPVSVSVSVSIVRLNGWQRLWVVVTVIWLAISGILLWQMWSQRETGEVYLDLEGRELRSEERPDALKTIVQRMIDAGEPEDRIASVIREYPPEVVIVDRGTENIFPPGTDPKTAAAIVRHRRNVTWARLGAIWLLPPLVFYGFGSCVGWVYRGFKRSPPASAG